MSLNSFPRGENQLWLIFYFPQGANSANQSRDFAWLQHKMMQMETKLMTVNMMVQWSMLWQYLQRLVAFQ